MTLSLVTGDQVPSSMTGYTPGEVELTFNAGLYRLAEISMWRMIRQPYQIVDDMFGRLIPTNEPFLVIYLSGSFQVQAINAPILPMNKFIDNIGVSNSVASMDLAFSPASLDLAGCPAVGRCGPLITPDLYTPPGVALTVCDTVPSLTTYSVTLNTLTATLAGEINEAYVYIKDGVLTLYAGKKIGDLVLSWVSQEQGDVQLIGYIEGAPPAPMANLTNRASYAAATSLAVSAPTSVTLKLLRGSDTSNENKIDLSLALGGQFKLGTHIAPFGLGVSAQEVVFSLLASLGGGFSYTWSSGDSSQITASSKLDETNKYTVKMQGASAPVTGDQFMANLNSTTTQSTTVGTAASRSAILPNPNLGGFTSSNPPAALPRTPDRREVRLSACTCHRPMARPSSPRRRWTSISRRCCRRTRCTDSSGSRTRRFRATSTSSSFRMNSQYLRPGVLDGMIGYVYNPATLPSGAQTYTTSTGQMEEFLDGNFSPGTVGHNASYMRIVEAYKLKRQIDQQAFNALALYQSQYNEQAWPTDSRLTPGLDFYNEYIWSARGGTQEVKHTYTTTYDEVYSTTSGNTTVFNGNFNIKLNAAALTIIDFKFAYTNTSKFTIKSSYNTTGTSSFDITASFDGIENDTQMRYASNNDAHFVMKNNSMFNPNNQSGLNLVIGSDGLVYNIVPIGIVGRGAADVEQPRRRHDVHAAAAVVHHGQRRTASPATLEPYDRPGKTKQFRTYAFFLQPTQQNADDFWNTVVDPVWLANSSEADARRCARRSSTPRSHGACSIASPTRALPPAGVDRCRSWSRRSPR